MTRARGARPRGLSVLLDAHAAALAACRRCRFDDPAVLPVISSAREPLAMLVGQAPGKTEVIDRRPFAGRAGRTLFRWFASIGIDEPIARKRIYIAAITRCFPGSSPSGRGDRVPSPSQVANCSTWLDAEIEMIRPAVVIPVGRLAIERFLGSGLLSNLIGRAHRLRSLPGAPVAVFHDDAVDHDPLVRPELEDQAAHAACSRSPLSPFMIAVLMSISAAKNSTSASGMGLEPSRGRAWRFG